MLINKLLKPKNQYHSKGNMKFSSKEYENPFFENKKKFRGGFSLNFSFSRGIKLLLCALSLVLIVLVASAIYSGYFDIKNIEIKGEGRISTDDIRNIVRNHINEKYFKIISQKNIFLFSTEGLKRELENKYVFDSLDITKDFPDKLQVVFKEKTYAFILKEDEKFFYADKEGTIIDEISPLEISDKAYPVIKNESASKTMEGKIIFNVDYINFALLMFAEIKKYPDDIKIDYFVVDNDVKSLKLALTDGPKIFFNTDHGIAIQVEKLLTLKREKLKDAFAKKEYIDLRFGESIYYR
jgi:hypothetical protein